MSNERRADGRTADELRKITVVKSPQKDPAGSVLIEWGLTKVLCSVTIEDKVPQWMANDPTGWITAEYNMLPGSSDRRIGRDRVRTTGRTHEIQRLIGRSIRASLDLKELGMRTVTIDCDVIQADGGTRVASITGAYLALRLALDTWKRKGSLRSIPSSKMVSAVSLGKVNGKVLLDLDYSEDVRAEVDANVVMNDQGQFIEIQGTAEKESFSRSEWNQMLELAEKGCRDAFEFQRAALKSWGLL